MQDSKKHPIEIVDDFLRHTPEITSVEMSVYRYRPQAIADDREFIACEPRRLREVYEQVESRLKAGEEIAFHSRMNVSTDGRQAVMHMPMIDFKSALDDRLIGDVREVSTEFRVPSIALYSSGRSYHFYGMQLLAHDHWARFMARILLLNMPAGPERVDCRWVGHRLLAGFASLRWSHNTRNYRGRPRLDREINLAPPLSAAPIV